MSTVFQFKKKITKEKKEAAAFSACPLLYVLLITPIVCQLLAYYYRCIRFSWAASYTVCVYAKPLQSCSTLCDPVDYSPPGFYVHGILQAVGCHFPLQGIFPTQGSHCVLQNEQMQKVERRYISSTKE